MQRKKFPAGLTAALTIFAATLSTNTTPALGQQETVLYTFSGPYGAQPYAGLIFDTFGNLYGTTVSGGGSGGGVVFELTPQAGGGWAEKVRHNFGSTAGDGVRPYGSVILDASGNLYGTTSGGGAYGGGTVFELTPTVGGNWTETVLHDFGNGTDGTISYAGVVFDASGNLYGTTSLGGAHNRGTVFELTPTVGGGWTERVLYSFSSNGTGGFFPYSGLILDAIGNLYGTTISGGTYNAGAAFELTHNTRGNWSETTLHDFGGYRDGVAPYGGLVFDAQGNLYGTTFSGGFGNYPGGTAFELVPKPGGGWTESVLYDFSAGSHPSDGLILDAYGNLYGTTSESGQAGTVFELTPTGGGGWTERVLHSFSPTGPGGRNPYAGVIFDSSGNLYGTTGGNFNFGTVFEITP